VHTCHIRKVPSQASTARDWVDLSMSAGNPVSNYYAATPLAADTLSSFRGIFHGDDKSPATKHLVDMMLTTPTAALVGPFILMDYLLYYPFVDMDDGSQQDMDNTTTLPRYTTGEGVRAMMVTSAPTTGSGQFTYSYINQSGNPNTSPVISCSTSALSIASLMTCTPGTAGAAGPFLPMATGDTGIRSITSHTNTALNGGLGTLVLVKPLAYSSILEINTPLEKSFIHNELSGPRIYDGAYLNMIMNCGASVAAGLLTGRFTFVWN